MSVEITVTPMQGTECLLTLTFTDVAGVARDPTTAAVKIITPDGEIETEYAIGDLTHTPGTGIYTRLVDFSAAPGQWTIQVETTGNPKVVETAAVGIRRPRVALG